MKDLECCIHSFTSPSPSLPRSVSGASSQAVTHHNGSPISTRASQDTGRTGSIISWSFSTSKMGNQTVFQGYALSYIRGNWNYLLSFNILTCFLAKLHIFVVRYEQTDVVGWCYDDQLSFLVGNSSLLLLLHVEMLLIIIIHWIAFLFLKVFTSHCLIISSNCWYFYYSTGL